MILKTNKATAIRLSTLEALCRELGCQPGDLREWGSRTKQELSGNVQGVMGFARDSGFPSSSVVMWGFRLFS
jgi:hypothetical protein